MHSPSSLASGVVQTVQRNAQDGGNVDNTPVAIRQLFLTLFGAYGNLFASKFATGERDANGKDKGTRAAMRVWAAALAKFPDDVIATAADRARTVHPEFPPNLPQFELLCDAAMPRKTYLQEAGLPQLPPPDTHPIGPVSYELRNDGKDWARRILARSDAGDRIKPCSLRFAREGLGIKEAR